MDIRNLHENFGAEVRGFDLLADTGATSRAEIDELRAALAHHQLLLVRSPKQMSPDRQVEIASWFGRPAKNDGKNQWSVLRNDEAAGSARLPFHSDFTYTDSPIKAISLHAIEVPRGGTATSFLSGVHAWATLPCDLQELLSPMTVRHVHDSSLVSGDLPVFIADQPVRFEHPRIMKPVLLVTECHSRRINELSPEMSEATLSRLFEHLYRPQNIYVHEWRLYDLLLWDNLAVQHARPVRSEPDKGGRALQRVALNEVDYPELIERARRRQHV